MAREQRHEPGINWFKSMDRFYSKNHIKSVECDLENNPEQSNKVKLFRKSFIKFSSLSRVNFKPNLNEEIVDYFKRKRAYNIDSKGWKKISLFVFNRDDFTCSYCGERGGILEVDHIIAFSKGGSDSLENLTTSCRRCNRSKRDKSVKEFLKILKNPSYGRK